MRLIDADALNEEIKRIFFLLPVPENEFCIEVVNCYLNTIAQRIENVIENMPTIAEVVVREEHAEINDAPLTISRVNITVTERKSKNGKNR